MSIITLIKTPTRFSKNITHDYKHSVNTNTRYSAILGKYNLVKGYYKNKTAVFTPPNYESVDVGISISVFVTYLTLIYIVDFPSL